MTRQDAIRQQHERGGTTLAVLPIHYPKEILTAMGILAVEMWGPPGPPRGPEAGRIQPYVCAVVRNALAFLAAGGANAVDGVLFPHTCDSIQGLATVAPDVGGWDKLCFRFIHPKGDDRPSARRFVETEMRSLASQLESLTGAPLDLDALRDAIVLHREIDALRGRLLDNRAHLPKSDTELYSLLRRGEFLWPEDHLSELEQAATTLEPDPVVHGVPVLVTGIVPEPMTMFAVLEEAGAWVAGDDYAAVGRRVNRSRTPSVDDPFAALVGLYFGAHPCSTRQADPVRRTDHLEELVDRSGAAGVIIHVVKFCEPELFDVPSIRTRLEARGTPVLYLESDLEGELSGQVTTRLEAFVEMLGGGRTGGAR